MTMWGRVVAVSTTLIILFLVIFRIYLYRISEKERDVRDVEEAMTLRCYQTEMGAVYVAISLVDSLKEGSHQWAKKVLIKPGDTCP